MILKLCRKCGEEKGVENFYQHSEMKDGRLNICICCVKARVNSFRLANLSKIREADRIRGRTRERLDYQAELGRRNRKERAKYGIAWKERNPEKRAAHILVGNAVRDGRVKKGACEICGSVEVDAHHEDYLKPLEVRWFCKKHHAELHRRYK